MNTLDFLNTNKYSGDNTFVGYAQYIRDNWAWLKYSYAIAIIVRRRMSELGMTQKQLAEEMGCSQQHISVLLNGRVNMTLETLAKLENSLQLNLLGNILEPLAENSSAGFLNDPAPSQEALSDAKTSSMVDGYKPRKKKGPKK